MGRRQKEAAKMGRSLIKNRFRGKPVSHGGESFLHTTELNDGYEGSALNLQSVTEQTSMADFLMTAELAGRDFTAEKENVQLVTPQLNSGILSPEKLQKVKQTQDLHKNLLRIPRRPPWQESTSADQLRHDEHMSFLEWRRQLARLQEEEHIVITPYEKNLEFWRQLWRVIERSDVVVQIVDARNPLLFWCPDVDKYVREVDPSKQTLLLINKADLLSANQRQVWAEYFASQNVRVVFWSAVEEAERLEREEVSSIDQNAPADNQTAEEDHNSDYSGDESDDENGEDVCDAAVKDAERTSCDDSGNRDSDEDDVNDSGNRDSDEDDVNDSGNRDSDEDDVNDSGNRDSDEDDVNSAEKTEISVTESCAEDSEKSVVDNTHAHEPQSSAGSEELSDNTQVPQAVGVTDSRLHTTGELLALFRHTAQVQYLEGVTTVGMVGYPNVGKSSTINTILRTKKVAVSATPGRTKHFQTLYVDRDLMLCDCPGLVFPSFVNSKAELVVNGILPIDQLQDSEPPVELVCHRVGRSALEALYHLNFPPPEESEDPDKGPSAYDLLQAYGALRGFMSHKGNPDRPRAARYILKDFVSGKLLYCNPPPGVDAAAFQKPPYRAVEMSRSVAMVKDSNQKTASEMKAEVLDREFFTKSNMKPHVKGPHAVGHSVRTEGLQAMGDSGGQGSLSSENSTPYSSQASLVGKPWKKHNNRNKKEKLRRVYKDLDQH